MNDNHRRHLIEILGQIDHWLTEMGDILAAANRPTLFAAYRQDASPRQRQAIDAASRDAREALARVMVDLNLPQPAPVSSTLRAARTRVISAQITLVEIEPRRMAGYGPLSATDAATLTGVVGTINAALAELMGCLAQDSGTP